MNDVISELQRLLDKYGEQQTADVLAAALARKPVVTDEMRRAGAQVLAEQAPFYFADATAKMETKPNSSALHIAGLVLNAALARDNITVGSTDDAN